MNLYLQIVIYNLVCVLLIFAYGLYCCKIMKTPDILTNSFFSGSLSNYLDGWGISHFLFFAFLGYKFNKPKYILFSFLLGVLWEIGEIVSSKYIKSSHISKYIKCTSSMYTYDGGSWWYGRYEDIIMNSLGLAFGYWLSMK